MDNLESNLPEQKQSAKICEREEKFRGKLMGLMKKWEGFRD